jgi:hypothetical protein
MAADYTECEYELSDRTWTAPRAGLDCPTGSALFLDYEVPTGYCSYSPLKWDAIIDEHSTQAVGVVSWWQPGDPTVTANGQKLAALPYGTALVLGSYRCDSTSGGVFCQNESTGHGFSMSRESYGIY